MNALVSMANKKQIILVSNLPIIKSFKYVVSKDVKSMCCNSGYKALISVGYGRLLCALLITRWPETYANEHSVHSGPERIHDGE